MKKTRSDFRTIEEVGYFIKIYGVKTYLNLFKDNDTGYCPRSNKAIRDKDYCENCCSCGYSGTKNEEGLLLFEKCHKNSLIFFNILEKKQTNMEVYE